MPEAVAASFEKAAFGLGSFPDGAGALRRLEEIQLCRQKFATGERLPLAKAIVRTCPRLVRLTLPHGEEDVSFEPEDLEEYGAIFSIVSTLKNIEELSVELTLPYFPDWSALRAANQFRCLHFSSIPSHTLDDAFYATLIDYIEEKNLAFAELTCGRLPIIPASEDLLMRLLNLYHAENVTLSTFYYRALSKTALATINRQDEFGSIVDYGEKILEHPLFVRASLEVPSDGETSLNVLWFASDQRLFTAPLFKTLAALEMRFHDVLEAHGRYASMDFVDRALQHCVSNDFVEFHDALIAEFPNVVSEEIRLKHYVAGGSSWEAEMVKLANKALETPQESRDENLRSLFFPSPEDYSGLGLMDVLLQHRSSDSKMVRCALIVPLTRVSSFFSRRFSTSCFRILRGLRLPTLFVDSFHTFPRHCSSSLPPSTREL